MSGIGINQEMLPVLWGLMLVASIAWLFLSNRLLNILKENHEGIYKKLGEPGLIKRKKITGNSVIITFLLQRGYEQLNDDKVTFLCRGLRNILFIFIFCLSGCLIILFGGDL